MLTPFFPQFRPRLAALGQRVKALGRHDLFHLEKVFAPFLPPGLLSQSDEGLNSRHRVYSIRCTFFGFLWQVLNPGSPCREVVRQIQAIFGLMEAGTPDENTSAYCQARVRLPWDILPRLRCAAAAAAEKVSDLWFGWRVKVLDGTGTSLPDTPANQRAYPQSAEQRPGCGFPWMRIVGVFSLASGVLLDYAKGNKHTHELNLLQRLMDGFKAGDLVLADRGFSSYGLMAMFLNQNVACLFRLHQRRPSDFRQGQRLGKNDRLMVWQKPLQKPAYLTQAAWRLIPECLAIRLIRFSMPTRGFRTRSVTLVTTLLDADLYSAEELARLYGRRWKIELWFRDIKTSMGMEVLRCQSPRMIHKEVEMHFIAYNLIRCLMTRSASIHNQSIHRISFKGTVDSVRQFSAAIAQARGKKKQRQLLDQLLEVIARDPVPDRPGRREPRAVKRRPKPYPLLNRHRRCFKEIPHRNRWWKNNPRKSNA